MNPARGGPYFLVNQLHSELQKKKINCSIVSFSKLPFLDFLEIAIKIHNSNLVHLFGGWNFFHIFIFVVSKILNKKLIIHPLGFYEPWSLNQKKLKKKIAFFFYQKKILKSCDLIHCASIQEKKNLLKYSNKFNIKVVPYGIDDTFIISKKELKKKYFKKKAVFVSRIHKKKGIDKLVKAWIDINDANWTLDIIGPSTDKIYYNKIKDMCGNNKKIKLLPPIYNSNLKSFFWSTYDLLVFPTYSENFGIVILEFLSRGVPVLTTENTPWSSIKKNKAGWIIKNDYTMLVHKLRQVFNANSSDFEKMSVNALLVAQKYSWKILVYKYISTYKKLLNTV